ncbi:MAG: hypothetical protein ABIJ56_02060 [Pseudomonadota bacterium]
MKEKCLKNSLFSVALVLITAACEPIGNSEAEDPWNDPPVVETCDAALDPANPVLKISRVDFMEPGTVDNAVLEDFVSESMASDNCVWLLSFSGVDDGLADTDGKVDLRMGVGERVNTVSREGCYRFARPPFDETADMNLDISGSTFSTPDDEARESIDIPLYLANGQSGCRELFLTLPIRDFFIETGTFSEDRRSLGTELECGAEYGGVITVADAMDQVIDGTGMTLCGLMSGDKGTDPSDPYDDCLKKSENWPNPPDAQYEGAPAFSIRTCFSAEQVMLAGN